MEKISLERGWLQLVVLGLVLAGTEPARAQLSIPGDVTGDGLVDGRDALKVVMVLEGRLAEPEVDDPFWSLGDVHPRPGTDGRASGDGEVTREDATQIMRVAIGLFSATELDTPPFLVGEKDAPARDVIVARPFPKGGFEDLVASSDYGGLLMSRTRIQMTVAEDATVAQINAALAAVNGIIAGSFPELGLLLIRIPDTGDDQGVINAIAVLADMPGVVSAEPDMAISICDPGEDEETGEMLEESPGALGATRQLPRNGWLPQEDLAMVAESWRRQLGSGVHQYAAGMEPGGRCPAPRDSPR